MVSVCLPSDALLQHLPSYLAFSYLGRGISFHGCSSKAQLLLLTLDEGYLLTATPPDLECGVAPLGPPAPMQPPPLGGGVAPLGRLPWPQACYDQPRQHIRKWRHYLLTKVRIGKAIVFPVVRYRCKSWTIMKAEHQRIDALKVWCWRRLLRAPWTERRSNQSILKEINLEYSLKGLMLKLKLQCFGRLKWRVN